MSWHPLLARQFKHAQIDADTVPPPYRALLAAIDAAYQQFDAAREQLERTLDLNTAEQHQAQSEMRAVYERLIASSLDGIFAFDLTSHYTVWNPVMERLTGITRLKTLNKPAFDLLPQWLATPIPRAFQDVLAGKTVFVGDFGYRDARADQECIFDIQFTPLLDAGGSIIGGLGVMHDITQRKMAQEAQQRQYAYLDAIQEMALRLNSSVEQAELLTAIIQRVGLLLATDDVFLAVLPTAGTLAARHYGFGMFEKADSPAMALLGPIIAEAQRTSMPQVSNFAPDSVEQLSHWAVFPVLHGVQVAGLLGVARGANATAFEAGEIAVVRQLAQLAAIALQQEALNVANNRLAALATTDPLTTLPNHRNILDHMEATLTHCHQRDEPCAILFVDIDHFKTINDTWGHQAGDAVLLEVSQRLARTLRRDDVVGRYGGEEFLVLLKNVHSTDAARIAEDLRLVLCNQPFTWQTAGGGAVTLQITASMGIAIYPHHGLTRDKLIEVADGAMYRAKHEGRNRVCFATSATVKAA
ncbi:MAG: diguanylate cyclase [Ktedonobacterales bacterium]|nr:diguanylate cyclase [Ktedonobacterales bacterium]